MRGRYIRGRGNRGFIAMLRGLLGRCGVENYLEGEGVIAY